MHRSARDECAQRYVATKGHLLTYLPILHGDFQVAAFGEAKRLDHETRALIVGNNQMVHVGQHMVVRQLKDRD